MAKDSNQKAGTTTEAPAKKNSKFTMSNTKSGIMGLGMALVIVSIAWSTIVVGLGTDWAVSSLIMLAPQAAYATFRLFYAFFKTFK